MCNCSLCKWMKDLYEHIEKYHDKYKNPIKNV